MDQDQAGAGGPPIISVVRAPCHLQSYEQDWTWPVLHSQANWIGMLLLIFRSGLYILEVFQLVPSMLHFKSKIALHGSHWKVDFLIFYSFS